MARAFIVLARNDLHGNLLQILDLKPNASQRNSVYDPVPQTHYKSYVAQNDTVALNGGNMDGDTYGLAAYLMDHVDDGGGALSAAEANNAADDILERVDAGLSLTSAAIGTILEAVGAAVGTRLDSNGSTGTIQEMLRVLSGEVFLVPDGTAAGGDGGYFVERPTVLIEQEGGVGRRSTKPIPRTTTATLGANEDLTFRDVRVVLETDALRLSAISGALYRLASDDYIFINPSFTYGAAGTALTMGGSHIDSDGEGRAVTVYDASGNVIV